MAPTLRTGFHRRDNAGVGRRRPGFAGCPPDDPAAEHQYVHPCAREAADHLHGRAHAEAGCDGGSQALWRAVVRPDHQSGKCVVLSLAAEHRLHDAGAVPGPGSEALADSTRHIQVRLRHRPLPRRGCGQGDQRIWTGRRSDPGGFRQRRPPGSHDLPHGHPRPAAVLPQQR